MSKYSRLGTISTYKEQLAMVIIEMLRHIAPETAYQFRELSGGSYQLQLFWGTDSEKLIFTEQQAIAAHSDEGRESVRARITAAIVEILKRARKNS